MSSETATQPRILPTPFHSRTAAACQTNQWNRWAGYTTVDVYESVELEYFAIRNTSTLYDVSPMTKYRIGGPDSGRYLSRLVTRDLSKLTPGRVTYVAWCDDAGHVLDDGTIFRLGEQDYRLCSQERHLPWLTDCAIGFDVTIEDETEAVAGLALQGPTSCALLKRMGLDDIGKLRPFHMAGLSIGGGELMVSRTGFTGDLGYELWVAPDRAEELWDRLMEAGKPHGLRPVGSQALNLARIEAGFIQTNADFVAGEQAMRATRGRSPFELGLGWMVDFDKGHFNGRRALLAEKQRGSRSCLVGLDIEGNKPAAGSLVYHRKRVDAGHITSAMWSPTCKRNIAIASLKAPYGLSVTDDLWVEIYVLKELKWDKVMARCKIVERPFYNPARRWATPAPDF